MNQRLKVSTARVSSFLQHATPFVLIPIALFFLYVAAAKGKTNEQAISDVNATAKNSEKIIKTQRDTLKALATAVVDLKADNRRQTVVLCTLILGANVKMTDAEATEVEAICQREIERVSTDTTTSQPETSSPSTSQPQSQPTTPVAQQPAQPTPQPTQNSGVIGNVSRSVVDFVNGLIHTVF